MHECSKQAALFIAQCTTASSTCRNRQTAAYLSNTDDVSSDGSYYQLARKFGQHLWQESISRIQQPTKWQLVWEKNRNLPLPCFMRKSGVTLCQHLLETARRRHGILFQSVLVHCWSWHMHPLRYLNKPCMRGLSHLSIVKPVPAPIQTKIGRSSSQETSTCEEDSTNTCCSEISCQKNCLPRRPCFGDKHLFHTRVFFSISIGSTTLDLT